MDAGSIDRNKLRAALRRLGDEYVFYMLDEAIEHLPSATLAKIAGQYLDLKQLRPDQPEPETLLAQVATFDTASRAGQYYEGFNVNSKTCMTTSMGTRAFIADCNRLLARCVEQTPSGDPVEIRAAIERILDVLRYIDECHDDVIFFADEGGAWQVCVDWPEVLPALFACVAQTSAPEEYARTVVEVINEFDGCRREEHLAATRGLGTAAHRNALRLAEMRADPVRGPARR